MTNLFLEQWRPCGYDSRYIVSTLGRVVSLARSRRFPVVLRPSPTPDGHLHVGLTHDYRAKTFYVHRLVIEAFVGGPPHPGMVVRHLNGDKADNRLCNLAWGSQLENVHDTFRHWGTRRFWSKITPEQVADIRLGVDTAREAAVKHGCSTANIKTIRRRQTWRDI